MHICHFNGRTSTPQMRTWPRQEEEETRDEIKVTSKSAPLLCANALPQAQRDFSWVTTFGGWEVAVGMDSICQCFEFVLWSIPLSLSLSTPHPTPPCCFFCAAHREDLTNEWWQTDEADWWTDERTDHGGGGGGSARQTDEWRMRNDWVSWVENQAQAQAMGIV